MAKYLVSFEIEADEKDLEELKKLEHHAEYLLDLDVWPEIKSVSGVKLEKSSLTRERLKDIFLAYVNNDASGADPAYIREVLDDVCGLTDYEKDELGLGWTILEDDEDE